MHSYSREMQVTVDADGVRRLKIATEYDPADLAAVIREELDSTGYIVAKGFSYTSALNDIKVRYQTLCEHIGDPVSHDENNSIIWDIKKVVQSSSVIQTYSEHDGEAELHTDSQYRAQPEDYFGLLTLKRADCGGGMSKLLSLPDILQELHEASPSGELAQILTEQSYPFIVPTVFNQLETQAPEFVFAPILNEDGIRFRVDTIAKALPYHGDSLSNEAIEAFQALVSIINHSYRIKAFHLEPGECAFINNKTMLHGRTAFSDVSRHMLRIRMNKCAP